jgi:hypothetical protein
LRYNIIGAPKNLKKGPVPYLGLELTIHVIKSQIYLVRHTEINIFMMVLKRDHYGTFGADSFRKFWLSFRVEKFKMKFLYASMNSFTK